MTCERCNGLMVSERIYDFQGIRRRSIDVVGFITLKGHRLQRFIAV